MNGNDLQKAVSDFERGDASAFARLVDGTKDRLVRVSARILGNLAEAEDAVQEAYVRAYRALSSGGFDGRSTVETWLYRIVVNATLDAKRARARRPAPARDDMAEPAWDGGASAEAHVALRELSEWLGALPEEQQVAMVLKVVEGFSSAEVAAIMHCSEGAVEQRLVRARTALRARGDHGDEERGGRSHRPAAGRETKTRTP